MHRCPDSYSLSFSVFPSLLYLPSSSFFIAFPSSPDLLASLSLPLFLPSFPIPIFFFFFSSPLLAYIQLLRNLFPSLLFLPSFFPSLVPLLSSPFHLSLTTHMLPFTRTFFLSVPLTRYFYLAFCFPILSLSAILFLFSPSLTLFYLFSSYIFSSSIHHLGFPFQFLFSSFALLYFHSSLLPFSK